MSTLRGRGEAIGVQEALRVIGIRTVGLNGHPMPQGRISAPNRVFWKAQSGT
jgi:hypothetical protein